MEEDGSDKPAMPRHISRTSFGAQANALLRKNLTYQARNCGTNACLVSVPILMCVLLAVLQLAINAVLSGDKYKCGCTTFPNGTKACGPQYSDTDQLPFCAVPHPPEWPALMQVPQPQYRAANTEPNSAYPDLPAPACRASTDPATQCPTSILYTGNNQGSAQTLASFLLNPISVSSISSSILNPAPLPPVDGISPVSQYLQLLANVTPGTYTYPGGSNLIEPAFAPQGWQANSPIYILQDSCTGLPSSIPLNLSLTQYNVNVTLNFQCLTTLTLWRTNSSAINTELYNGYSAANSAVSTQQADQIEEYSAAYDFQGSTPSLYSPVVWYNSTFKNDSGGGGPPPELVRFPRALNLASNAFVKAFWNASFQLPLLFVKDFPKPQTNLSLDFSSLLGPLFYIWILQLLFPVFTANLVYEKEKNLRTMMRMHGLGDGAYWLISYAYFLAVSVVYMAFFIIFGSIINLKFFRLNSYGIQIVLFFVFSNTQISLSIFFASLFSNVRTATVVTYLYVFGTGLLGEFLFRFFLQDSSFPTWAITLMELIPAFALYRGLYELAQSAFIGNYQGTQGTLTWSTLRSSGVATALLILAVEWALLGLLGLYLDQVISTGSGVKKHPLFFLNCFGKSKDHSSSRAVSGDSAGRSSQVDVDMERADVAEERESVEKLLSRGEAATEEYSIVCDGLRKVYPGRDGNMAKVAVKGLSLAIPRGECFGMLGPNGAGKSTSINMMIGFLTPSSGTAYIEGLDIRDSMDAIYGMMGVCPQHDLLWEQLTGREHLLFYARLKNLKGAQLKQAVEESLKSVNLWNGGVGDKRAGAYSGGMKRRLSVAISLIGDPLVVYMDEPSTGLDPASRMNLWSVVKAAKKDRGIVLTTHSMEEAEELCDRLGIFVDGQFQCIGNPRALTKRYGGTYVLTLTTPMSQEEQAAQLAKELSPNAKCIYSLAGTQKFELPTAEVDIADVFGSIEQAKAVKGLKIQAWGLANTTLEDVFIRIAKDAQTGISLN